MNYMNDENIMKYVIFSALTDDDGTIETMWTGMYKDYLRENVTEKELEKIIIKYVKEGYLFINYASENPICIRYGVPSTYYQVWFSLTKYGRQVYDEIGDEYSYLFAEE